MPKAPVSCVVQSLLRPLTRATPDHLHDAVWVAVNQVYGASRFAHEIGETDAENHLLLLHKELMQVYSASPGDQSSYLEGLLRRWK